MQAAVTILIDGLTYASWLFIVAVGLTLVFGVLKILNIAHGSFYALGAYAAASFVGWAATMKWAPGFSIVAMLLAAVVVAAVMAPLTERGLLRFFYGRDEVLLVLVTYAMFLILEDVTKLLWGTNPYYVSEPYGLFGNLHVGVQTWVGYDFFLVALAVVVGLAVWWGLNRTRHGKITLAVIHSAEVAASMGVNVSRVYMAAFSVGIFLAALGGGAESVEQLVATAHPAADVGADGDFVAAHRLGVEQVVEARHRLQICRRHLHHRGGLADALRSAPAVEPLYRPERRDRDRVLVRVAPDHRLDLLAQLGRAVNFVQLRYGLRGAVGDASLADRAIYREVAHRSTPPRIGSSMPRLQIRSAM